MTRSLPVLASRFAVSVFAALLASGAVAQPEARAFKAKLVLTESVRFLGAPPCFAIGSVQATGSATHLGTVTAASSDCINPQGVFNPSGPTSFSFASNGTGTTGLVFTASNGDLLFATYSGALAAQPSGPHRISGQFVITGGTGRFLGATGGGTLSGYEDISQVVSGHGEIEAIGTIAY